MKTKRMMMVLCLAGSMLAWGCGTKHDHKHEEHESDHHEHGPGPHKGVIEDFGKDGKHHVEIVFDRDKKEVTVYVLGLNQKDAKPIKCDKLTLTLKEPDVRIELKPQPLPGETDGLSSVFVGTDEKLGGKETFVLSLVNGEIAGKPYVADYKGHKVEAK